MQHQFQSFGPAVIAARVNGSRERAPVGEFREACVFLQLGGHVIPRHRVSPSASPMTGSGGGSGTLRLIDSITAVSGILDPRLRGDDD
jgi:hypothetical protein